MRIRNRQIHKIPYFLLALSTALPLLAQPARAQELDALDIVKKTQEQRGKISFEGLRRLQVLRQNTKPLVSRAEVVYADQENLNLKIKDPVSIAGIQFNVHKGVNSAYFPDEKLYFYNGDKDSSDIPISIILSEMTDNFELLRKNYSMARLKDDFVALTPAYVLDLQPIHGLTITPGRRYWISKNTFQILREERYWDPNADAYYNNHYERFSITQTKPAVKPLSPPNGVNKVNLSGQTKNSFFTYRSIPEAEQKEKLDILEPTYVPNGFQLKNVQVFTLMGGRMQILNYTDGLNDLMVNVRPIQNAFVTLVAGAFSLNLLKKMSELSYHAPNNYMTRSAATHMAVSFGDVAPEELKKTLDTIPLPAK